MNINAVVSAGMTVIHQNKHFLPLFHIKSLSVERHTSYYAQGSTFIPLEHSSAYLKNERLNIENVYFKSEEINDVRVWRQTDLLPDLCAWLSVSLMPEPLRTLFWIRPNCYLCFFFFNTLVTVQTCCKPHSLKYQIQLFPQIVAKFRHVSTISREKLLAILYLRTTLVSEQHKTIWKYHSSCQDYAVIIKIVLTGS